MYLSLLTLWICDSFCCVALSATADQAAATACSSAAETSPIGAVDGERFLTDPASLWKGASGKTSWWWQIQFDRPRKIGAILQVVGDHPRNFRNAPLRYIWQYSQDGQCWRDLRGAAKKQENRLYRIHRLKRAVESRFVRLVISEALGDGPTIREVEFYAEPTSKIEFEDWIVSVSSRESSALTANPCRFTQLLRQCKDWSHLRVQYLWHGDFDEDYVSAEPQPMCAFLSGSSVEWCQRSREPWRGVQQVLASRNLPMWGACGGAQILPILQETGVDAPWDCPRCRDPGNPKLPVYSHIGHTGDAPCGDYSKCIGERGKFKMRIVARDPVLEGLSEEFEIMESHVGQIAYLPKGWLRVVTKGPGAHTTNQCIRVKDRYIYAAQFHMELPGTPENSQRIMSNFLSLSKGWGGYNPNGAPVEEPEDMVATSAK
jgi:GMP synthase-like glutamine amidotransferase